MQNRTVNSIKELAHLVHDFREDGEWIFRGVRQNTYTLLPKIGRPGSRKGAGSPPDLPYDRSSEQTMIRHFIRAAGPYVKHIPNSLLEWLALAQHHGMFTRLLDWTESLLVAAYFAVEDARHTNDLPLIYCCKGVAVAQRKSSQDLENLEELNGMDDVMLYYPPHISPRIPAQSSVFTVHMKPDQEFVPDKLVKIQIGQSPLTFKLDLNACGVHKASLFPDINGLAEHQSWLYKWGKHMQYGR